MTLRSALPISIAVLASRVLGLVRETVFAALFGAGAIADAYQVAFRVPNLLRDLFAEGALSNAFVPTFTAALQQDGRARAEALADLVMSLLLLVTGAITALAIVFAGPIVDALAGGFAGDEGKVALAVELTRVMLPILTLVSLAAVWMGMLNAQRRFVVPALAPALFNVVSIAAGVVVLMLGGSVEHGIFVWSIGTVAAGLAQALVQLVVLVRMGYRPRLRFSGMLDDPSVRRILRLVAPATIGIAAVNVNVFVNTAFAGSLGDGPVAQLSYAFRLFFVPLGIFGVAIATVTATSVSEEAAKGDRVALAQRTADGGWATWMLTSASAVALFVLAEPIVRLCFRWGATSVDDARQIADVLRCYVVGLVPYALVKLYAPAFYSVDKPRVPMIASIVGVAANLAFNAATYRELGAPGIAFGTTIGALVNVAVLRVAFARAVGPLPRVGIVRNGCALVLGNLVLAALAYGGLWAIDRAPVGGSWTMRLVDAGVVAAVGLVGVVGYAITLARVGYPGADRLLAILRRRR
jgi:putative peptidoglycan lipid II flippase